MRKLSLTFSLLLLSLTLSHVAIAQNAPDPQQSAKARDNAQTLPSHYYHLDFVIEEVGPEGRPVNSRSFSTTLATEIREMTSIRAGSRIPINKLSTDANAQIQYVNVGQNIDIRDVKEIGRQLAFNLVADLTGMTGATEALSHQPVVRNNRWQASVLVPVGKSTVVFTSDSLDSKGSMRVLVTATPLQ